jgi:transcriptional regulator with XRE-family HTH domain
MITRSQLLQSPEYWFDEAQNEFYRQVTEYMNEEGLNQTQLAERLHVTKGYISQILKGEFNYTLKKLIELSLAIGKVPQIDYKSISEILVNDNSVSFFPFAENAAAQTFQASTTLSISSELMVSKYYPTANKAA